MAEARSAARGIGDSVIVKSVTLVAPGATGFLGIGKKRGKWTAELFHQAVCEISYQTRARVRFQIGKEPKTVVTILREFLIEHEEEVESLGGMRSLEFIDVLRNLVNSNFSEEITRSALQRSGRMGELTRKFLKQIEQETEEKSSGGESVSYAGPPVRDLTQDGVVAELQRLGLSREAADTTVQAALVLASTMDRQQINAIYQSDMLLTRDNLALKWATHCIYHGARPRRA